MKMEMPEGLKRLNEICGKDIPCPVAHEAVALMKEMAECLELYANGLYGLHPLMDVKGPAIQMIRKFQEWK